MNAINKLVGKEESVIHKTLRQQIGIGLGRSVRQGNTGRCNGKQIFDKNEEHIR